MSFAKKTIPEQNKVHELFATSLRIKKPRGLVGGVFCDTLILPRVESKSQVQKISEVYTYNQKDPIANRTKTLKPIANSLLVDKLLLEYQEYIDPAYTKWFAKRFYTIPFDQIHRCASEARQEGKNPQRLFAHLIGKFGV